MTTPGEPIREVVIVGGGTAGWMTAAALSRLCVGGQATVTLIESDEIGTVGVGEATIPSLHDFHAMLGIDEDEFIRATGATFKLGIAFDDWGRIGERYLHPFGGYGRPAQGVQFHHLWLKLAGIAEHRDAIGPIDAYNLTALAAHKGRFARPTGAANSVLSTLAYAFHLDAGRYARWLRGYAEERGVRRIEGRIEQVSRSENGDVAGLHLASGRSVEGQLFVDCSGFAGLVIGRALGIGFRDWRHWLPCDRAVAIPTASVEPPRPYTRAIADAAGWRWRIPLQHRVGNGYVYCSAYIDDDAARARLVETVEGQPLAEPRVLRFGAGRRETFWHGNCIAIGLSAGFIEPLESTSIHLIQSGIARLMALFPDQAFDSVERDAYNQALAQEYDQVRDFIILHYKLTERSDTPFWERCRTMDVPDSLAEKMALFAGRARLLQGKPHLFTDPSWLAVMLGQGMIPRGHDPLADALPLDETRRFLDHLREVIGKTADALPSHAQYIAEHCSAPIEAAG